MPRIARSIIEGLPHHVTQRGSRRQRVFFSAADRRRYLAWLREYAETYDLEVWSYCLMTNHLHLVVVPGKVDAISRGLHALHARYARRVNADRGWTGHLWQGRFFSAPLEAEYACAAIRYVERNPVRCGLIKRAEAYPWSSAAFHVGRRADRVINASGIWGAAVEGWANELRGTEEESALQLLRERTQRGFPCGSEGFVARIGQATGRDLTIRPRGRPRKQI